MNALLALRQELLRQLSAHPQTQLALLCALLDPFPGCPDNADDEPLLYLIAQLRDYVPQIYAEAVTLWYEQNLAQLEKALCAHLQKLGLPIEQSEDALYGVPMPAWGIPWECEDWSEGHSDLLEIMALFGINPLEDELDEAQMLAQLVFLTLEGHENPQIQQIGCAVGFLFSTTGNSSVDFSRENLSELVPLEWSDLAFALEIIEEAQTIMAKAQAGLQALQNQTVQEWLSHVITITERALREKGSYRELDRLAEQLRPRLPALG